MRKQQITQQKITMARTFVQKQLNAQRDFIARNRISNDAAVKWLSKAGIYLDANNFGEAIHSVQQAEWLLMN